VIFQPYVEPISALFSAFATAVNRNTLEESAACGFFALLIARFAGTVRDVFAVRPDDAYIDGLPIEPVARLHDILLIRLARTSPVLAGIVFAVAVAGSASGSAVEMAVRSIPYVALGAVVLAVVETATALVMVRCNVARPAVLVLGGVAAGAAAVLLSDHLALIATGAALVSYGVARHGFRRWRTEHRDRAREALARARRSRAGFEQLVDRLLGSRTGAQVVRDLRLVRRGFSTAPYIAAGVSAVIPALAVWICRRYELGDVASARAIETATVLSTFALAGVTHAIVNYERPRIWIDLTGGVEPDEFPKAKIWLGRVLAMPALLFGAAAARAAGVPLSPGEFVELAWLVWATSSLTAVFCYEMPDHGAAGLVLAFIAAVGDALLVVFYTTADIMWYFGPFLYVYVMSNILPRAGLKAASRA
jgi:hypothetical protein